MNPDFGKGSIVKTSIKLTVPWGDVEAELKTWTALVSPPQLHILQPLCLERAA